jgi:hypothetical protein
MNGTVLNSMCCKCAVSISFIVHASFGEGKYEDLK